MKSKDQLERFKEAARALGCDENEAAFDEKLKAIASSKTQANVKLPAKPKSESK